jgi:antitoxin component of MazEF toxin-antitoxin module
MARNELGEENVRKLQRTGRDGETLMVTLPKELVEELGWREHQKVTVHAYGKKLIIEDWQE